MAERKRNGLLFDEVLPRAKRTAQSLLSLDPQEDVPASQQALEMALGFVPGIGQAMALRDIERARRAQDPTAGALAAASLVPFGRLLGKGRSAGPIMSELDVYHGTPHRFPATEANPLGEFDASKIGTGEGQQVYGHGIYLAEAQDVGDSYRRALTPHQVTSDAAQSLANYAIRQRREPEAAIQWLEKERKAYKEPPPLETMKQYDDAIAILRQGNVEKVGNLYKADLPDEMIDRMLDWDKPLSEQPAAVRNAFNDLLDETGNYQSLGIGGTGNLSGSDAADLYNDLKGMWNENYGPDDLVNIDAPSASAAVSEFLRRRGILGIKYADAGSRGQGGSGTRNFVVFPGEEKKVKILERK